MNRFPVTLLHRDFPIGLKGLVEEQEWKQLLQAIEAAENGRQAKGALETWNAKDKFNDSLKFGFSGAEARDLGSSDAVMIKELKIYVPAVKRRKRPAPQAPVQPQPIVQHESVESSLEGSAV
jgi:hypothetical protein